MPKTLTAERRQRRLEALDVGQRPAEHVLVDAVAVGERPAGRLGEAARGFGGADRPSEHRRAEPAAIGQDAARLVRLAQRLEQRPRDLPASSRARRSNTSLRSAVRRPAWMTIRCPTRSRVNDFAEKSQRRNSYGFAPAMISDAQGCQMVSAIMQRPRCRVRRPYREVPRTAKLLSDKLAPL